MNHVSYFREVAGMLGWRSCRGVAMLWGFFDESHIHDTGEGRSGHAVRSVMGGCIAPSDAWMSLIPKWSAALRDAEISAFHMADYENDVGEFAKWKTEKADQRKKLLNTLLGLMVEHATGFVGTFLDIPEERRGAHNQLEYRKMVVDTLRALCAEMEFQKDDKIAVVFARHDDFRLDHILAYRAILEDSGPIFGPVTVDDPIRNLPLQAADIFAYELRCHFRYNGKQRYPLNFLLENAWKNGAVIRTTIFPEPAEQLGKMPSQTLSGLRPPRPPVPFR